MKDESRAKVTDCRDESPTAPDDLAKGIDRLIDAFKRLDAALERATRNLPASDG